jgi:hypothetical protein
MSVVKKTYFKALRQHTNLTGKVAATSYHVLLPSAFFIGDSIVRASSELASRYKAVSPSSRVLNLNNACPTNLTVSLFDRRVRAIFASQPKERGPPGVTCVGGPGSALHALRRDYVPDPENGIKADHLRRIWPILYELSKLASHQRVAYVGSMPVDAAFTLMSRTPHPPHMQELFDFSFKLLGMWADMDEEMARNLSVPIFDTRVLAHECPRVRCDGMHFASHFPDNACCASGHLWDRLLLDFKFACKHLR